MAHYGTDDRFVRGNNCLRYEHLDGYPMPESKYSCRGCRYSYDPELYDPGCKHPDGLLERDYVSAIEGRDS